MLNNVQKLHEEFYNATKENTLFKNICIRIVLSWEIHVASPPNREKSNFK